MRGRTILSILLVIVLLAGTIYFILPPVQAYTTNVGISYVGASHELPLRQEQSPETVIVNAFSEGTDYVERTFTVSVYYYTTSTPGTLIGTQSFTLKTSVDVPRNETAKAVSWDISAIPENTYKFYAAITAGLPGADENAADNTRTSLQNPTYRQRMLGIIAGHNVGVGDIQGSFPNIIKSGTTYGISLTAFNNGYFAESFTVTTYYNSSAAPTTFVAINVTTITNLPAKTGSQAWAVTWDTTGRPEDEYSLSANASIVSSETITYEQFDFCQQDVTIIQHDLAVLDVIAYPTGQTAGQLVKINMTVENQGAVTETSFTVRMKANVTEIPASPKIVPSLASGANTTVTFDWYPAANGFYTLNGSADFVAGEDHERADNVYRNDDIRRRVNVPAIHNVATTFVSTNATYAKPGDQVSIFAVVQNRGDYDESFSVTPYYDGTQAASPQVAVISKRADTGEPYGSQNLGFVWDTTGVPLGTYYIKVAADVVSGETYTSDNNLTDGRVVFTKVYIDPALKTVDVSGRYNVKPTTHTVTGTLTGLTFPTRAYDNDNATYASLLVTATSGNYVDFHTFTPPGLTTNVAQVDIKIRYSALAVPVDVYRITQGVTPSGTYGTLVDWRAVGIAAATTFSYDSRIEPNDGVWSWTDVQNIDVRFESDDQIAESHTVRPYEVWANVYNTLGTKFYCKPTANVQSGVTVTNPTFAYDATTVGTGNTTYAQFTTNADGYFSLKTFNITAGVGTISRVDLRVRYYVSSTSDRFRIGDLVSPSTSQRDLVSIAGTTSEVNFPLQTQVFSYRPEPNSLDGNWSWTDVSNIRVRFTPYLSGTAENREVRIYEVWATVYDKPFSATYNVGGVSGLAAWSARITWDPTVIDLLTAQNAGFFGVLSTAFQANINHTGGYADLSETVLGVGSTSGSGALANLAFKVLKAGKSRITPTISLLVNTQGQNMEHFEEFSRVKTPGFPLIGDFNGDGAVDAIDISMFNLQYGKKLGDVGYDDAYDLFDDNVIDAKDLRLIGTNYW